MLIKDVSHYNLEFVKMSGKIKHMDSAGLLQKNAKQRYKTWSHIGDILKSSWDKKSCRHFVTDRWNFLSVHRQTSKRSTNRHTLKIFWVSMSKIIVKNEMKL